MSSSERSDLANDSPVPGKKTWIAPEIRDQSIESVTQAKSFSPSESSPNTGPVS
ncbi:hypothetical protein AB7M35_000418 [Amorphus suaedae]